MKIFQFLVSIFLLLILINNSFANISCRQPPLKQKEARVFIMNFYNSLLNSKKGGLFIYKKYFIDGKSTSIVNNHYSSAKEFKKHAIFLVDSKVDKNFKLLKIISNNRNIFVKSILEYSHKKYLFFAYYELNQCNKILHFEELSMPLTKGAPNDIGYKS